MAKRALISVYDKEGLVPFVQGLAGKGYEIISTGGTAKVISDAGTAVMSVEDVTGFPACFSGRVKTLHPAIAGGILFDRSKEEHASEAAEQGIVAIDLVCVNLYPFAETLKSLDGATDAASTAKLIEQIDIGGVTLLRAAAKNMADVTVVCESGDYELVLGEMDGEGSVSDEVRSQLAAKAFAITAAYDGLIAEALSGGENIGVVLGGKKELRYGENPHQWGTYYSHFGSDPCWTLHQGKELSYLNVLDADGAINAVSEFDRPAAVLVKHATPCGIAESDDLSDAFQKAYDCDPLSAFGVIVALNKPCTKEIIQQITEQKIFCEVLIAPGFDADALALLEKRPKVRAISVVPDEHCSGVTYRSALGGTLVQNLDTRVVTEDDLTVVTESKPSKEQIQDLLFAWKAVKHSKSNAIVFASGSATVGIGAGQTSRVDATQIAARHAGDKAAGAVMASDAFFPFPDSVEEAASMGIAAIIQPGGSIRDEEVIAKANELGIPMVVTGVRGFRH